MTSRVIKNIRTIRIEKNYSQEYMSLELKISQSYYGRIENGKCKLDLKLLFRIADVLEINFENLFKEDLKVLIKEEKMIKKRQASLKWGCKRNIRAPGKRTDYPQCMSKIKQVVAANEQLSRFPAMKRFYHKPITNYEGTYDKNKIAKRQCF